MAKLHIKKGDTVFVIAGGSKSKEKTGRVLEVDPKTGKPTRVGRKAGENGKLVRYAKKSGEEIK